MTRYELLQSISQGENGTLSRENEELALIANDIVRATTSGSYNEEKYGAGPVDAVDFFHKTAMSISRIIFFIVQVV